MKKLLLASAIAAASATAAHAVPLAFTYTTQAGWLVEGTMEATPEETAGHYTHVNILSARIFDSSGTVDFDSDIQPFVMSQGWYGSGYASTDGSKVDFLLCWNDCNDAFAISSAHNIVMRSYPGFNWDIPPVIVEETFVAANWTLDAVLPAVPAPASLPLAAAGIGALAMLRRRKKAA